MKTCLFISALIVFISFSTTAFSQSTASATASATIVTPVGIVKSSDMGFGNISLKPGTSGTIVLAPSGSRTGTNGITFSPSEGCVSAASFTVTGTSSYTYDIILPTLVTLTLAGGSETMTASSFSSNLAPTNALSTGIREVAIGATVAVTAKQQPGIYTSTGFDVTLSYN